MIGWMKGVGNPKKKSGTYYVEKKERKIKNTYFQTLHSYQNSFSDDDDGK